MNRLVITFPRLPLTNFDGMGTGYMALSFQLDLVHKRVWVD